MRNGPKTVAFHNGGTQFIVERCTPCNLHGKPPQFCVTASRNLTLERRGAKGRTSGGAEGREKELEAFAGGLCTQPPRLSQMPWPPRQGRRRKRARPRNRKWAKID